MRGSTKAQLIQSTGKAIDVAVSNYGHKGAIVACVLKYMYGGDVGTQLIYTKKARNAMFMVLSRTESMLMFIYCPKSEK
jgi:hypothetical protein